MRGRRTWGVRIVAAAGVVAALIGLIAPRSTLRAQKVEDAPAPKAPADLPTIPETPQATPVDASPLPPASPPPGPSEAPGRPAPVAYTPDGTLADPEAAAKAFVERGQKEADAAITALSQEAETLRARLRKVEAGLSRWQAVKDSLGASSGEPGAGRPAWRGKNGDPTRPPEGPPTILEPASPAPSRPRGIGDALPDSPPRPAAPDDEPKPAKAPATPDAGAPKPKESARIDAPLPEPDEPALP